MMVEELPTVRIFNSESGEKEALEPLEPGVVKMYVCGLTVYDYSHIGHARTFIAFDIVRRYLAYRGYDVQFVRNHTDVDDKIIARANEIGEHPIALAERFIGALDDDLEKLGLLPPTLAPRVTEEIPTIVAMVERLVENGHAYVVGSNVFFDVASFPRYGTLSKKVLEDLRAGERVEVDETKKHPADFAVWKGAKPGEPQWESPWGPGRPGWHIECSAMSTRYLGDTIDIHGGGRDLIFPHHENEIAQSEAATGKPFVRLWMHGGPLNIGGEKMSKSLGNFCTVREALTIIHPEVIRFFNLTALYRKPISYTEDRLEEARNRVVYFYKTLHRIDQLLALSEKAKPDVKLREISVLKSFWDNVHEAMDNDFNTPRFLAILTEVAKTANELLPKKTKPIKDPILVRTLAKIRRTIVKSSALLGLFQQQPDRALREIRDLRLRQKKLDEKQIDALMAEREKARGERNWARADQLRDSLSDMGVVLMDSADGTEWELN